MTEILSAEGPTKGNKYKLHAGDVSPLQEKENVPSENNLEQTP